MNTRSSTYVRQNLATAMDEMRQSRAPMTVTRQNGAAVVMLSLEEFGAIEETLHLLRSPANAARLAASLGEADARRLRPRKAFSKR